MAGLCLAAILGLTGQAAALTSDGALVTNTAFATFSGVAGIGVLYRTTYLASSNVLICNPMVGYVKTATPEMVMPTGTVTFALCVVNSSVTTSAFNLVLSDRLPDNMEYQTPPAWNSAGMPTWTNTVSVPASAWTMVNGAALAPAMTAGEPATGQDSPWFMRWTINIVGPGKSACIGYAARVL